MSDRGSADMEFAERAQEAERQLAAALTEIRTANEVLAAQAEAAAMWDRLLAIWQSEDGEPTKAHDYEVLERIAALVSEWNLAQPPVIVPASQVAPYIVAPIGLADPDKPKCNCGHRWEQHGPQAGYHEDCCLANTTHGPCPCSQFVPGDIVHRLRHGFSLCRLRGAPADWPEGNKWVGPEGLVTCGCCLAVMYAEDDR